MWIDFEFTNEEDDIRTFVEDVIEYIEDNETEIREDLVVDVDIVCKVDGEYYNFDFKVYMDEDSEDEFEKLVDEVAKKLEYELNRRV